MRRKLPWVTRNGGSLGVREVVRIQGSTKAWTMRTFPGARSTGVDACKRQNYGCRLAVDRMKDCGIHGWNGACRGALPLRSCKKRSGRADAASLAGLGEVR